MAVLLFHKFVSVLFILTLCFLLAMPSPLSLQSGNKMNRKVLDVNHRVSTKETMMVAKGAGGTMHGQATRRDDKEVATKSKSLISGELREVPSGPDPLHHHGAGPKNPAPSEP